MLYIRLQIILCQEKKKTEKTAFSVPLGSNKDVLLGITQNIPTLSLWLASSGNGGKEIDNPQDTDF